jgi:hypothetical protein
MRDVVIIKGFVKNEILGAVLELGGDSGGRSFPSKFYLVSGMKNFKMLIEHLYALYHQKK